MTHPQHDIILIEDNRDDIELTLLALEKFTIHNPIKVIRNGAVAINYLFQELPELEIQSHLPKLILLDLKLPKIDGIQVLERIKSDTRTRPIPVVILTSSREQQDLRRCFEIGANSYVVKPVEVDKFDAVLRKIGVYWLKINEKGF